MKNNKNNKWNKLSMREKADLMKIYLKHGIYDLNQIREHYNNFDATVTNSNSEYTNSYAMGGNLFDEGGPKGSNSKGMTLRYSDSDKYYWDETGTYIKNNKGKWITATGRDEYGEYTARRGGGKRYLTKEAQDKYNASLLDLGQEVSKSIFKPNIDEEFAKRAANQPVFNPISDYEQSQRDRINTQRRLNQEMEIRDPMRLSRGWGDISLYPATELVYNTASDWFDIANGEKNLNWGTIGKTALSIPIVTSGFAANPITTAKDVFSMSKMGVDAAKSVKNVVDKGVNTVKSNADFINRSNNWFNGVYGYDKIPLFKSTSTNWTNNAVKSKINQHNTFVRGLRFPDDNNIQIVKKLIFDKTGNANPTKDEIYEFMATTYAPLTNHGRAGLNNIEDFSFIPANFGTNYASNEYDLAFRYAVPNQNDIRLGSNQEGRIYKIQRKTHFGPNRDTWIPDNEFNLIYNNSRMNRDWGMGVTNELLEEWKKTGKSPKIPSNNVNSFNFDESLLNYGAENKSLQDKVKSMLRDSYYREQSQLIERNKDKEYNALKRKYVTRFPFLKELKVNENYAYPNVVNEHRFLLKRLEIAEKNGIHLSSENVKKQLKDTYNRYGLDFSILGRDSHYKKFTKTPKDYLIYNDNAQAYYLQDKFQSQKNLPNLFTTEPYRFDFPNSYQHYISVGPIGENANLEVLEYFPVNINDMKSLKKLGKKLDIDIKKGLSGSRGHSGKVGKDLSKKQFDFGGYLYTV